MKIEIVGEKEGRTVGPVEAYDVVILFLHPDASDETPFVVLPERPNVEDDAANFAQKLAANVLKLVVLTIEARGIQIDHLKEAARNKARGEEFPPVFGQLSLQARVVFQWLQLHAVC